MTDRAPLPLPPPTHDLRPLADLLGLEGLLRLLERRGGTRLQVPNSLERSRLASDLGDDMAAALIGAYGGMRLKVPLGREWRIQVYHARGLSYGDIAVRLGLTEDGVWRSLATAGLTAGRRPATKAAPATREAAPARQYDLLSWLGDRD